MNKKLILIIAIAVVAIAAVAGIVAYYSTSNNYVATVSTEKITVPEYKFFLASVKSQMEGTANLVDENAKKAFWTSKIGGVNATDAAKDKALEQAKEYKIQLIKAKESKMKLDAKDLENVKSSIDNLKQQIGGNDLDKNFVDRYGVTVAQYTAIMKDFMLVYKFIQQEQTKITVADDELKTTYDKAKDTFDKVTVNHVLFLTVDQENKPLPDDKQQEAKKKADDVLAKVKAGTDIKELAKQYSEDPGSKDNGGEYTFKKQGQYVPEFEDWAFKAKVGDSDIIKTSYGYHVMKLAKRTEFEEVKSDVKNSILGQKYMDQLEQWKKDQKYNVVKNTAVYDSIKAV